MTEKASISKTNYVNVDELLRITIERGASDLHLRHTLFLEGKKQKMMCNNTRDCDVELYKRQDYCFNLDMHRVRAVIERNPHLKALCTQQGGIKPRKAGAGGDNGQARGVRGQPMKTVRSRELALISYGMSG